MRPTPHCPASARSLDGSNHHRERAPTTTTEAKAATWTFTRFIMQVTHRCGLKRSCFPQAKYQHHTLQLASSPAPPHHKLPPASSRWRAKPVKLSSLQQAKEPIVHPFSPPKPADLVFKLIGGNSFSVGHIVSITHKRGCSL